MFTPVQLRLVNSDTDLFMLVLFSHRCPLTIAAFPDLDTPALILGRMSVLVSDVPILHSVSNKLFNNLSSFHNFETANFNSPMKINKMDALNIKSLSLYEKMDQARAGFHSKHIVLH